MGVVALQRLPIKASADSQTGVAQVPAGLAGIGGGFGAAAGAGVGGELEWHLAQKRRAAQHDAPRLARPAPGHPGLKGMWIKAQRQQQ